MRSYFMNIYCRKFLRTQKQRLFIRHHMVFIIACPKNVLIKLLPNHWMQKLLNLLDDQNHVSDICWLYFWIIIFVLTFIKKYNKFTEDNLSYSINLYCVIDNKKLDKKNHSYWKNIWDYTR